MNEDGRLADGPDKGQASPRLAVLLQSSALPHTDTDLLGGSTILGDRLRFLREAKNMSQGDIERKCGLKRCCISQVENSHTVPCMDTLEKWARALSVPLYQVFYDGDQPPTLPPTERSGLWGSSSKEARLPELFCKAFALMNEDEEQLLMHMGRKMERANQSASHVNRRPQVA